MRRLASVIIIIFALVLAAGCIGQSNAVAGTDEEVKKTKARLIYEKKQGFGNGYIAALKGAKGDIIIMSEPDGTYDPKDVFKFLAYSDDFDVVFGSRTTSILIGEGANMGWFLKWGNWGLAKMVEILFNTAHLTDVGCTYRLIKKEALNKIENRFVVIGSAFNPDMMLQIIRHRIKFIEIPVNYLKRTGKSSVMVNWLKINILGLGMVWLILKHKFGIIKK